MIKVNAFILYYKNNKSYIKISRNKLCLQYRLQTGFKDELSMIVKL